MNYDDMILESYRRIAAYILRTVGMMHDLDIGLDFDLAVNIFRKIWQREPKGLAAWLQKKDEVCEERYGETYEEPE